MMAAACSCLGMIRLSADDEFRSPSVIVPQNDVKQEAILTQGEHLGKVDSTVKNLAASVPQLD